MFEKKVIIIINNKKTLKVDMYEELHRNKGRRTGIKRDVQADRMFAEGRFRCTRV